jgi:hypothetical protein
MKNCKECQFEPENGHAQTCSKRDWRPICLHCGKKMYKVWDEIARCYTGYLWHCDCMPLGINVSIG